MIQWIAACADYPSLYNDLTYYLGQLLSTDEANLVTVNNLTEISRLPWSVEGEMPPAVRLLLLNYLEEDRPSTLLLIRQGLHRLLDSNCPPEESAAYDDYRMTMAFNEWLFTPG